MADDQTDPDQEDEDAAPPITGRSLGRRQRQRRARRRADLRERDRAFVDRNRTLLRTTALGTLEGSHAP